MTSMDVLFLINGTSCQLNKKQKRLQEYTKDNEPERNIVRLIGKGDDTFCVRLGHWKQML